MSQFNANNSSYSLTTGVNLNNYSMTGNIDLGSLLTVPLNTGLTVASSSTYSYNNITTASASVNIGQDGIKMAKECDITLGNLSLKSFMENIEKRLAILSPNPILEKEWEELQQLGDRYRALEQQIEEKMKTWNILQRKDTDDCDRTI